MSNQLKVITLAGFKGGVGKSSISRLLAEKLGGSVLNFDPKRDAEFYNSVSTLSIKRESQIERIDDYMLVDDMKISSNNGYLICDFGGYFDERLSMYKSDIYVLPTADDLESISETVKTAKYILKNEKKANIIYVLNKYLIRDKNDEAQAMLDFKTMLEENSVDNYPIIEMPYSKLFKKIVNEGVTESDLKSKNALLNHAYKGINKFIDNLIKEIKDEK